MSHGCRGQISYGGCACIMDLPGKGTTGINEDEAADSDGAGVGNEKDGLRVDVELGEEFPRREEAFEVLQKDVAGNRAEAAFDQRNSLGDSQGSGAFVDQRENLLDSRISEVEALNKQLPATHEKGDVNRMTQGCARDGGTASSSETLLSVDLGGDNKTRFENQMIMVGSVDPDIGSIGMTGQVVENKNKVLEDREDLYMKNRLLENLIENKVVSFEEKTESEDEDEEDTDFNPFLQRSPSPEASSGLSSENDDIDDENGTIEGESLETPEDGRSEDAVFYEENTFLELGSEDEEEEEVDDNEEEEDENNEEEELDDDSKEVCNKEDTGLSKHFVSDVLENHEASTSLVRYCSSAKIGLDSGVVEEDTGTGFEGDMNVRNDHPTGCEKHGRPHCTLELWKRDGAQERTEEEMIGCTFAALSDLRSPPRREKLSFERQRDQSRAEEEQIVDAICKRTRAHYSLTDMSLDELETFLQESDEEDYFQNVDDEEEYRKFVAAVQGKWDGEMRQNDQDGGKEEEEDEDEEDDYDFEVEIEEALESDYEETSKGEARKRKHRASGRRPETRDKRRQRARPRIKERLLGLAKTPLRPLLPSIGGLAPKDSAAEANKIVEERLSKVCSPNAKSKPVVNGFTAHQIGQLHCLIHEHVQLLLQVFSLCILEPSRQQIAIDTHRLLMELVDKRDQVLSWKKTAFPEFCFCPPYIHASISDGMNYNYFQPASHKFQAGLANWKSSFGSPSPSTCDQSAIRQSSGNGTSTFSNHVDTHGHTDCSPAVPPSGAVPADNTYISPIQSTLASTPNLEWRSSISLQSPKATGNPSVCPERPATSGGKYSQCVLSASLSSAHPPPNTFASIVNLGNCMAHPSGTGINTVQVKCSWAPVISGPVHSLLDVAPLALVKEFLADVAQAVQEYRQRHVESGAYHSECEREPLFPFSTTTEYDMNDKKPARASELVYQGQAVLSSDNKGQAVSDPFQIKKTMAAALVETTKKQSIALVPKDIAVVIRRFIPLFNPAMFPHKPPPAAAANRLLFTDAEDELLAMGLMTYNTNWKAIQQHFLPSKTTHQIFVRQKNRSSARAPENSIKAVRKMKASPLTTEEKVCIQEGLKLFKYEWMKVWQHCVPYRDPAILPRQWRVAVGTQKSYKNNDALKERRRLYEAKRRQEKDASRPTLQDGGDGEVNSGEEEGDEMNEVYLHEAFLADWKPHSSHFMAATLPLTAVPGRESGVLCSYSMGNQVTRPHEENLILQQEQIPMGTCTVSGGQFLPKTSSLIATTAFHIPSALGVSTNFTSKRLPREPSQFRTYHSSVRNGVQTIKLAPGLPSLNLPPCVRVISQSKLVNGHCLSSNISPHRLSQHKCIGSSHNGKRRLAALSDASSCGLAALVGASPYSPSAQSSGGKRKRGKDVTIASKKTTLVNQPHIVSNHSAVAYSHMASENHQACTSQKYVGSDPSEKHGSTVSIQPSQDTGAQMHPLLMQGTFESALCSKTCSIQMPNGKFTLDETWCEGIAGQHRQPLLLQQIPQFHPFFGAPQGDGIVAKQQLAFFPAALSSNESSAVSSSELHPLLQEDNGHPPGLCSEDISVVNLQCCAATHPWALATTGGLADAQAIQHRSTASHPIIRPEPGRAVRHQQKKSQQIDFRGALTNDNAGHIPCHVDAASKNSPLTQTASSMEQTGHGNTNSGLCASKNRGVNQNGKHIVLKHRDVDKGGGMKQRKSVKLACRQRKQESSSSVCIHDVKGCQTRSKNTVFGNNSAKSQKKDKGKIGLLESGREEVNTNIVMEQEELSDSDEEVEEQVQFEYEEMGDSDREDSENGQQFSAPDRENEDIEFEEEEIGSDDSDYDRGKTDGLESCNQLADDFLSSAADMKHGQVSPGVDHRRGLRQTSIVSLYRRPRMVSARKENFKENGGRGIGTSSRLGSGRSNKRKDRCLFDSGDLSCRLESREVLQQVPADQDLVSGSPDHRDMKVTSRKSSESVQYPSSGLHVGVATKPLEQTGGHVSLGSNQSTGGGLDAAAIAGGLGKEGFNPQHTQESDEIALEAAQVLAVIHREDTA